MDLITDINFASSAALGSDTGLGGGTVTNGDNNSNSIGLGSSNNSSISPIVNKNAANFLNIDHLTSVCNNLPGDIPSLNSISTNASKQDANGNQTNNSTICDPTRFTNFLMCPDIGSQFTSSVAQNTFSPWISNQVGTDKPTSGISFGTSPLQANTSGTSLYNNTCANTSAKFDFNTPSFDFNAYNPASAWAPLDVYNNSNVAATYQCQRNLSATALSACLPAKFAATYPSINMNGFYYPSTYSAPYTRYPRNLLSKFLTSYLELKVSN